MTPKTPRTDAMAEDARNIALEFDCRLKPKHGENIFVVGIDFARQLETELAAAVAERDIFKERLETYSDDCAMMDNLRFELAAAKAQRDNWREVSDGAIELLTAVHASSCSVSDPGEPHCDCGIEQRLDWVLAAYRKLKEGK